MAVSHFTLLSCPNPDCPSHRTDANRPRETAVGDPVGCRWHCFACEKNGAIVFVMDKPAP